MRKWRGVLIVEGVQTGDGRFFEPGSVKWKDLPLALVDDHPTMATSHAAIGNVQTIERVGNDIVGTGTIDDLTPTGAERVRMMEEGTAPGGSRWPVSIEFHDAEVQIIDTTAQEGEDAAADESEGDIPELAIIAASARIATRTGTQFRSITIVAAAGDGAPVGTILLEARQDDVVERYTNARIHNLATVTAGAIDGAYIELDDSADDAPDDSGDESLVDAIINADVEDLTGETAMGAAATAPIKPPRSWFFEPEPEEGDERLVPQYDIETGDYIGDAVPLHIGDDGQVWFHVAPANRCHVGFDGVCVTPPQSASAYSHFHVGYTQTAEGVPVPTGPLCAGCDHASVLGLDERAAKDWYANMGLAWANVRVVPGRYGPWGTGSLRPGVSDELVVALRGGGVSGDWRGSRNGLELIGILAVSVPGFTVQRAMAASAGSVRIARAQSAMQMGANGDLRIITAPVMHAAQSAIVAAGANCGCDKPESPEMKLARENNALLRSIYANTAGPVEKARLAARIRR